MNVLDEAEQLHPVNEPCPSDSLLQPIPVDLCPREDVSGDGERDRMKDRAKCVGFYPTHGLGGSVSVSV